MASFDLAQSKVAINEGGYQNNPKDGGNWTGGSINSGTNIGTNYGISAPTLSAYLGRTATVADMQGLSYSTALEIYKNNYWDALGLDDWSSQSCSEIAYDGAVNEGVGFMSGAIANIVGISSSVPFSADTVAAINAQDPETLFDNIKQARVDKYGAIGGAFLTSWLYRVNSFTFSDIVADTVAATKVYVQRNWVGVAIATTLLAITIATVIIYRKKIIKVGNLVHA